LSYNIDDPSWDDLSKTFLKEVPNDRQQVNAENSVPKHGLAKIKSPAWKGVFDRQKYDPLKFWPLYNVLLVVREGGLAFRVGIGQIHINAFDPIATRKLIRLS
jgi:hypothetical protein